MSETREHRQEPWDYRDSLAWGLGLLVAIGILLVAYGANQANQPVERQPTIWQNW